MGDKKQGDIHLNKCWFRNWFNNGKWEGFLCTWVLFIHKLRTCRNSLVMITCILNIERAGNEYLYIYMYIANSVQLKLCKIVTYKTSDNFIYSS